MSDPLGAGPIGASGPGGPTHATVGEMSPKEPIPPGTSFLELLRGSINEVNDLQHLSGEKRRKYVTGEITSLHEVLIAGEESSISFNMVLQIRNMLLRAWDELKRMPV